MHSRSFYFVNALTAYRLVMAPVLIVFAMNNQFGIFKWLLAVSFFTDAIDGALSRSWGASSIFGSKLDSIADDLNIVAALVGTIMFAPSFLRQQLLILAILFFLFLLQVGLALIRYRRLTSFHTYLAKAAAIMQGIFFITLFFLDKPSIPIFYVAAAVTIADLLEEIVLVLLLNRWQTDVKGVFWIVKK